jgi:hypothetical protein
MRGYHQADIRGPPAEEIDRLRLLAESLFQRWPITSCALWPRLEARSCRRFMAADRQLPRHVSP